MYVYVHTEVPIALLATIPVHNNIIIICIPWYSDLRLDLLVPNVHKHQSEEWYIVGDQNTFSQVKGVEICNI